MSKLGVGVGDEFPADEVRRDEDGVVHHYHYRCRRRGGPLRLILWLALIWMVVRMIGYLFNPYGWGPHADRWAWRTDTVLGPYMPLAGMAVSIAVVGGALWLLRRRDDNRPRS